MKENGPNDSKWAVMFKLGLLRQLPMNRNLPPSSYDADNGPV